MKTIDNDQLALVTGAGLGDIIHSAVQAAKRYVSQRVPQLPSLPSLPALPAAPALPQLPGIPTLPAAR